MCVFVVGREREMYSGYLQKQYDASPTHHHVSSSSSSHSPSSSSSSSLQRVYCILWGTMLLDYHSYEDSMANLTPIYASEIIGVSKLEENNQLHGFLIVTLSGITHRLITKTYEEALEWMINIRVGLECVFGNKEIIDARPSKTTYDYPSCQNNNICPLTSQFIPSSSTPSANTTSSSSSSSSSSSHICKSCGYRFLSSNQFASCPVLHFLKSDESLSLCPYCYDSQLLLIHLKQFNYVILHSLHEYSSEILFNSDGIYQATSQLRQWTYPSLSKLSELKNLTFHDISILQQIEIKYQYHIFITEYEQMRVALYTLGNNLQYIINFLRNPILKSNLTSNSSISSSSSSSSSTFTSSSSTSTSSTSTSSSSIPPHTSRPTWMNQYALYKNYELVILRLLELSTDDSDIIDYYWFQLLSIYLYLSKNLINKYLSMYLLSLYQQCLLSIAIQYPILGMRMIWYFLAIIDDYSNKKGINQYQYTAILSLLLQYETYTYGGPECLLSHHTFPSILGRSRTTSTSTSTNNIPTGTPNLESSQSPFQSLLYPSRIQKVELWKELQTLLNTRLLIRRGNRYQALVRLISPESEEVLEEQYPSSKPTETSQDQAPISCLNIFLKGFSPILLSKPSFPIPSTIHDTDCHLTITSADWYNVIRNHGNTSSSFHKDQFQFMSKLFSLIDSLRFIEDYRQREAIFIYQLDQQFLTPENEVKDIGYDPTTIASEPLYRLKNIYLDECKIYRTKARTPTRIVFGVVIDPTDLIQTGANITSFPDLETTGTSSSTNPAGRSRRSNSSSNDVTIFLPHHHQHNLINGEENIKSIPIQHTTTTTEEKIISEIKMQVASKLNKTLSEMTDHMAQTRALQHKKDENESSNLVSPSQISRRVSGSKLMSSESSKSDETGRLDTPRPESSAVIQPSPSTLGTNSEVSDPVALSSESTISTVSKPQNLVEEVYGVNWIVKKQALITKYLREHTAKSRIDSPPHPETTPAVHRSEINPPIHYQEPLNLHHPKYFPLSEQHIDQEEMKDSRHQVVAPVTGSLSVWPYYDIRSYIFKTNDDLRQEIICMQLIEFCQEVFITSQVSHLLWLKPYRIVSTGASTGLVETLPNTLSLDAIKKSSNFISLAKYFENLYSSSSSPSIQDSGDTDTGTSRATETSPSPTTSTPTPTISLHQAKLNFVASLAAYSLICYVFQIKDRHNGNILLDSEGHIIHIDYGFILGIAPGGSYFSIETAPFKLTEDYIELLDGLNSPYFTSFIQSFILGFLLLQSKLSHLITMIEIFRYNESVPCFSTISNSSITNKDDEIITKLKLRLQNGLNIPQTIDYCLELIISSYSHLGTINYDNFQWYTNGIQP